MTRLAGSVTVALIACAAATSVRAQLPDVPEMPRVGRPFAMSGQASIFGEAYGITGRAPRRPGSTGRVAFQPVFQFTRLFRVSFDLQLTTEGNGAGASANNPLDAGRQRLNQLGISPEWSWGKLNLGDYTDSYTPFTYSGVRIRGAGAEINPGWIRLAAFRGSAQSAVLGSAANSSYARTMAGGRVGLGRFDGSYFDLTLVRAWDDAGSLPPPDDTAFYDPRLEDPTVDPDTLAVGTLLNPLAVTPQENVVASASGGLVLFDRKVRLHGELSGAGHSRDVRASALDNDAVLDEIPGFVRGLFTPRIGSSFGAAFTMGADVRLGRGFAGTASFRRVDPGFVALGVASLLNDQTGWTLGGTQRFGRSTSVRLDIGRQRDNLAGQKAFTTTRARYGAAINLRPLQRVTTSMRLQYVGMENGLAAGDARWVSYANWLASTSQTLSLGRDDLIRSLSVGYTYRGSGDANPVRAASSMDAHATTVRVVIAPRQNVTVTPSAGLLFSASAGSAGQWTARQTYGIAAQTRMRDGRWASSLSIGSTDEGGTGAIQARLSSNYNLTEASTVSFTFRSSHYRNAPNPFGPPGAFNERTASLQLTRRLGNGS